MMEWISIKGPKFSVPAFHVSTSYPGSNIPTVTTNMYFLHREGYIVTSYLLFIGEKKYPNFPYY